MILSKVTKNTRKAAEVKSLLDSLPATAWPCGACPEKVYGFIAAVVAPMPWKNDWQWPVVFFLARVGMLNRLTELTLTRLWTDDIFRYMAICR